MVYADLLGFGSGGPYSGRLAYDDVIQGMSGISHMMERKTGQVDYFPTIVVDKRCGHIATRAILAALIKRNRDGVGGTVEIPMFEATVAFNLVENLYVSRRRIRGAGCLGAPSRLHSRILLPS